MKQFLSIILILLICVGCKKKDNDNNLPQWINSQVSFWAFTATTNGNVMHADSAKANLYYDTTLHGSRQLDIIGYFNGNKIIAPGFYDYLNTSPLTPLEYDSLSAGARLIYIDWNDLINNPIMTSATLKITSVDAIGRKVSGSFHYMYPLPSIATPPA